MVDKNTRRIRFTQSSPEDSGLLLTPIEMMPLRFLTKQSNYVGKKYKVTLIQIECKDALSKMDSDAKVNDEKTRKVFVGGLPQDVTEGSYSSPQSS